MKKILLIISIIIIVYVMIIFIKPVIADKIAWVLWIQSINKIILNFKYKLDGTSTKIPSKKELEEAYSWAKDKVTEIKDNIDDIRKTADDLKWTYNETKDLINQTWEKINKVKDTLNDIQAVGDSINNVVNKDAIQ